MDSVRGLHRALGLRDVVLFYTVGIVSVQWWSTAAQFGPSSLLLWGAAIAGFLVPLGLAVMELCSRHPDEGGLYQWTRVAFGEAHGFLVGWLYIVANLVYLPFTLLFVAGTAVYVGGDAGLALRDDATYQAALCLGLLWLMTLANVVGLERAKWVANAGAVFTALSLAVLVACAAVAFHRFGSATDFAGATRLPAAADAGLLPFFGTMLLALAGFDLVPLMGGEVRDPRRTIPLGMLWSGAIIALFYLAGTVALLVMLPPGQIGVVVGIQDAVRAAGGRLGLDFLAPVEALLMTLAMTGLAAAGITAVARMPFVVGVDGYLPRALGRVHARWGSPYVALLVQAAVCTVLLCVAIYGSGLREAYQSLQDMTVILILVPYLYLFAAVPVLRARGTAREDGVRRVPGGRTGVWCTTVLGGGLTFCALVLAVLPPPDSPHPALFVAKVAGSSLALAAVGLLLYQRGRRRRAPSG